MPTVYWIYGLKVDGQIKSNQINQPILGLVEYVVYWYVLYW